MFRVQVVANCRGLRLVAQKGLSLQLGSARKRSSPVRALDKSALRLGQEVMLFEVENHEHAA